MLLNKIFEKDLAELLSQVFGKKQEKVWSWALWAFLNP